MWRNLLFSFTVSPDPATGAPGSTSAGWTNNAVNIYDGTQTTTSAVTSGSGEMGGLSYGPWDDGASLDGSGNLTSYSSDQCYSDSGSVVCARTVTVALTGPRTFADIVADAGSIYAGSPSLASIGPSGGAWARNAAGAIVSVSPPAGGPESGLGGFLPTGLWGAVYLAGVWLADVIYLVGGHYASFTASRWYVRKITFDLSNTQLSDVWTLMPPHSGTYDLEADGAFDNKGIFIAS